MNSVRHFAEFLADFPDDWIWNSDETQIVQTGGKAVAEAIAEILTSFGCNIEKLEDYVGHCWECSFSYEGLKLMFRVVGLEPAIFILEEPHRARADYDLHLHVLIKLDQALRGDGRFHHLIWRTYDNYRTSKEAFASPVDGEVPPVNEIKEERGFLGRLFAPTKRRPGNR